MEVFTWKNGTVPKKLKITQVYGLIFTQDGRMLLRLENKGEKHVYSLAGGKPEAFDKTLEDTLKRECLEEVNTSLKEGAIVVGYQLVNEGGGKEPYAQVRMVAIIDKIGKKQPDPDNNETYDRLLTTPARAIELLNWGMVGKMQIEEAVKIAKEKLGIKTFSQKEEFV